MTLKDFVGLAIVPAVILVGSIVFMVVFRAAITRLIDRIKNVGLLGARAEAYPTNQSPDAAKAATSEIDDAVRKEPTLAKPPQAPSNPPAVPAQVPVPGGVAKSIVQITVEQNIRNDPKLTMLTSAEAKVDLLIQYQAAAQIEVTFERVYRLIFGSQVRALRAAIRPVPASVIEAIFNDAKARFPEAHSNRTFEEWCQFMAQTSLGVRTPDQNGVPMVSITNLGHEFLIYMDRMGYREPWG